MQKLPSLVGERATSNRLLASTPLSRHSPKNVAPRARVLSFEGRGPAAAWRSLGRRRPVEANASSAQSGGLECYVARLGKRAKGQGEIGSESQVGNHPWTSKPPNSGAGLCPPPRWLREGGKTTQLFSTLAGSVKTELFFARNYEQNNSKETRQERSLTHGFNHHRPNG